MCIVCCLLDSVEGLGLLSGRGAEGAVSNRDGDSEAPWRNSDQSAGHTQRHEVPQVLHQGSVRRRRPAEGTGDTLSYSRKERDREEFIRQEQCTVEK